MPPDAGGRALPEGAAKARAVREMFDAIAPRYDLVNRVMTFGLDVRWRRRTIEALGLPAGSVVLDLASGTGDLCRALRARGHRPIGIDVSAGMLAAARVPVPLVRADVLHLPVATGVVDGVTCGFALRNLVDLDAFLAESARALRPGGRLALLEVSAPTHPVLRWGHAVYFGQVVPCIGALLSDAEAYRYLPRSAAYLPPPSGLVSMVAAAGFGGVERRPLSGGITQLIVATRRPVPGR
ncbi:MAG: ubiquinone/menaquinone biosynthesis methyltransferase [Acidimicrobiales bacterium]